MKRLDVFVVILILGLGTILQAESGLRDIPLSEVQAAFDRPIPAHPRLFMNDRELARIQTRIKTEKALQGFYKAMLAKADDIIKQKPVTRKQTGKRLLSVSRRCLDRVIHLSAAYRFSGQGRYLERAEREMLAAAGFTDWNPSHFLDVAEMTAALAIGYDWLYPQLSAESRATIRRGILEKGIQPARKSRSWVRTRNNWNQVCNGGITLGILALWEDQPELAQQLVHRAVNGVQVAMAEYEPDGAYPEGPGYWVYGTSYNVVLLAALESVLGTDFGLSEKPGFSKCAEYYLHVAGPTGRYFNYPDSGSGGGFVPAVFWFAQKYRQPTLAWSQFRLWEQLLEERPSRLLSSRLAPLTLLWAENKPVTPPPLVWMGDGSNNVAMFRSSWTDPEATYLAIKGGSPSVNHGHMDVGSFVIDAGGLRWALDLGPESYHKIESRGMNLWGRDQDAQRWTIFRYNNLSHNTLVVNGQHQRVKGYAPIVRFSDQEPWPHVVFDMSSVYQGQLAQALRGAALLPSGRILIQDDLKATSEKTTVRWAMVTPAQVEIKDASMALLKQKGKTMRFGVVTNADVRIKTYSTEPKADYDASNPGTRMVGFELNLAPGETQRVAVLLSPEDAPPVKTKKIQSVLKWSEPR